MRSGLSWIAAIGESRTRRGAASLACACWLAAVSSTWADEWPQWRGPTRDGVWRETGIVEKLPEGRIPLKWSVPISSGYTGPTVAGGLVYVMDRVIEPGEQERILAFDWKTGESRWSYAYDCPYQGVSYVAGPRASVSIADGRAFALGTKGHLHGLAADTGEVLWSHDLEKEYQIEMPIWGISASPLVDNDLVIVQIGGAEGACIVAFDVRDGRERWRALDDAASYSAPIIIEQAGRRVLVCWTGDSVAALDPATGELLWRHPFERTKMVISITTPVFDGDRLFVSSFYDGSLLLQLPKDRLEAVPIWRRQGTDEQHTDALHAIISTPLLKGDYVYGVDSYGELRCLDAKNGDRIWESLDAVPKARWATIHMVTHDDQVWMFNDRGELIIAELSPKGFHEKSRTKLIDPTTEQLRRRDGVCWSHPAYAHRHVFARNDKELVCASLEAE